MAKLNSSWSFLLWLFPISVFGQTPPVQLPTVSVCELLKSPMEQNGKQLQIRGKMNLEFEDFSLYDPKCNSRPGIWLMFGGDVSTPTKSTWNDNDRPKGKNVKLDGVEYEILKDEQLEALMKGLTATAGRKPKYRVTATLMGTFFARHGELGKRDFVGYGHMWCCHLFIIKQVLATETRAIAGDADERWRTAQTTKQ